MTLHLGLCVIRRVARSWYVRVHQEGFHLDLSFDHPVQRAGLCVSTMSDAVVSAVRLPNNRTEVNQRTIRNLVIITPGQPDDDDRPGFPQAKQPPPSHKHTATMQPSPVNNRDRPPTKDDPRQIKHAWLSK